jgi:hypothetical protein
MPKDKPKPPARPSPVKEYGKPEVVGKLTHNPSPNKPKGR